MTNHQKPGIGRFIFGCFQLSIAHAFFPRSPDPASVAWNIGGWGDAFVPNTKQKQRNVNKRTSNFQRLQRIVMTTDSSKSSLSKNHSKF